MIKFLEEKDKKNASELFRSAGLEYCDVCIAYKAVENDTVVGHCLFKMDMPGKNMEILSLEDNGDMLIGEGIIRASLNYGELKGALSASCESERIVSKIGFKLDGDVYKGNISDILRGGKRCGQPGFNCETKGYRD